MRTTPRHDWQVQAQMFANTSIWLRNELFPHFPIPYEVGCYQFPSMQYFAQFLKGPKEQ